MKRKINIVLSIIWIVSVYDLFFFMRSQLKLPTLNLNDNGWIIPVLMTTSFRGFVFALISTAKRNKLRIFTSVFIIIGIAASLCHTDYTTFFFTVAEPGIYPLYSETTKPDDCLIFDEEFQSNYEHITEIVPKELAEKAGNVI